MEYQTIRRYDRLLALILLAIALAGVGVSRVAAESLRLPAIFSDHMVLQRDLPVAVWGWAPPGQEVRVSFKDQKVSTRADHAGNWRVRLEPIQADAHPSQMLVASDGQTLAVDDVLVGEVWLCSGQSNMEWPVSHSNHAEKEIASANWPLIRHINAPQRPSMQPLDDINAKWELCSPQKVPWFTAVGYYFGRRLHQELDVPIGLLNCTYGGTRIEPWIPLGGYAKVPELAELYRKIMAKQPDSDAYQAAADTYLDNLNDWIHRSRQQLDKHQPIEEPTAFPQLLIPYTDRQDPTALYNGMMRPFIPFTIRGSIWYQGESNMTEANTYVEMTRALVLGWREKWERPDLPYYYVQLAPFKYGKESPHILAEFWEAQGEIEKRIENTGMVVVNDIGDTQDIHPKNKQGVGQRLADMALRRTYGYAGIIDTGPRYQSVSVDGDRLLVKFNHVADGLDSRDGLPLTHFELAGEDQSWEPARAEIISPDTLAVSADGLHRPVAVRFAWHKLAEPNLINSAGLPTSPFRSQANTKSNPQPLGDSGSSAGSTE